jgi:hypothetical protein
LTRGIRERIKTALSPLLFATAANHNDGLAVFFQKTVKKHGKDTAHPEPSFEIFLYKQAASLYDLIKKKCFSPESVHTDLRGELDWG